SGVAAGIETVVFAFERDGARALASLRRGELDVFPRVLPIHWPDGALTPAVRAGFREVRLAPQRFTLLVYNQRKAPLGDGRVRRALAMLIDRARLVREARRGLGRLTLPPLFDRALPPHDPAAATRLLDEAGLRDGNADGVRELGAVPLRLDVLHVSHAPIVEDEIALLRVGLGKGGVAVAGVPVDGAELEARLRRGAFSAALVSYAGRRETDLGDLLGARGALNFGGAASPAIDALLERLRREPPGATRARLWGEFGARFAEEAPATFLYAPQEVALVRQTISGFDEGVEWIDLAKLRLTGAPKAP
ncbi:MAG: ABC transporter substrate-binding protein, partial [Myxococcota bacterium]